MPTRKVALSKRKPPGMTFESAEPEPPPVPTVPAGVYSTTTMRIGKDEFQCSAEELIEESKLGCGAWGSVYKMRHTVTNKVMAVKRIRATVDTRERKQLLMDLNVSMKSLDCPYTITFYGALFWEGDVWICMELMHKSLHLLYKLVYETLKLNIPEDILGKIAEATIKALDFLKSVLEVMHRDVKPSNILINQKGEIKLCDFGIAGELVNSCCETQIGCKPYLAPERIDPDKSGLKYDQRSDIWSFGITMCELALGRFPYAAWSTMFDQLKSVVHGDAPRLPSDRGFSEDFVDFTHKCLMKDVDERSKYSSLVTHPFIKRIERTEIDVASWYGEIHSSQKTLSASSASV